MVAMMDFASKQAVRMELTRGESVPITEFFNLVHAINPGAAFSFLASAGGWQRYFFTIFAAAVSAYLVWTLSSKLPRLESIAFGLILGGAIGNAADRVMYGAVTDFLDFHWRNMHWPAFNFADIAICTGAIVMVLGALGGGSTANKSQVPLP